MPIPQWMQDQFDRLDKWWSKLPKREQRRLQAISDQMERERQAERKAEELRDRYPFAQQTISIAFPAPPLTRER